MEPKVIQKCRKIVAEHQCAKVNGKLVDATTANVIVKVYDALNETNRAKFAGLGVPKMAAVAWKLVS